MRLAREERLGALPIQLASGKKVALSSLQGSARVVLVAGTTAQCTAALEAAAPYKEELVRRGVLVVPLPLYGERWQLGGARCTAGTTPLGSVQL